MPLSPIDKYKCLFLPLTNKNASSSIDQLEVDLGFAGSANALVADQHSS
jgi:hypothetical protein